MRTAILALICSTTALAARQQAAAPAAPAPPGQEAASGAVSGVVTDASTHRPIEGVNIQLGPPPRAGTRLGNQITDERGRFVFTGVAAGTYFINATKGSFADGHYGPGVLGALGGSIVITDGQWFRDANIEIAKLGAIGGRVVDERGEAVVGAYVRVIKRFMLAGLPQLAVGSAAKTDDRGEYRIANLAAGTYFVTVPSVQHSVPTSMTVAEIEGLTPERLATLDAQVGRSGGASARLNGGVLIGDPLGLTALILGNYVTPPPPVNGRAQVYAVAFYPSAATLAGAMPIELAAGGEKSGVDLALQPVPAVRVPGHVDGASKDYAGYALRLMPAGLEDFGTGSEVATTTVRSDGSFTFLNVPAGTYTLTAPGSTFEFALRATTVTSVPLTPGVGRSGSGVSGGLVSAASGVSYSSHVPGTTGDNQAGYVRMPLTIGATDVSGLVVPLQRSASLHCQLVFEDMTGPPPSGLVEVAPANASPALGVHTVSINGSDPASGSSFTVPTLLPGEYLLRFNISGVTIKTITMDGDDVSRRAIGVTSGQDANVVVTLTGKAIKLSGVVRDAQGVPVPLASAIAFPVDKALWNNYGFTPTWIRPSVGSNAGSYQIANIRAGDYYLVGVDSTRINAWTDPAFLESAVAFATRVSLDWGDTKTVDLKMMITR